jgi:hydrogenase expression/formation protein HypD
VKLLDELREAEVIIKAVEEIRRRADPIRHYQIMEVCGGHTHAICSFGLKDFLPATFLLPRRRNQPAGCLGNIADSTPWKQ